MRKSLLTEKTLYHGTLIDNVSSIEKYGLIPSVGKFVKDVYESDIIGCDCDPKDYLKKLVFATDKQQLDKAVTAITAQIAQKLNKNFHSVTDDEFIKHGALAIVRDGDSVMTLRPDEDQFGEHPFTAEPGDYYSEDYIGVDYILTGKKMISLLKRYGVWPRIYDVSAAGDLPKLKSELIRLAIKYHKDVSKDKIMNAVNAITDKRTLIAKIKTYRKATREKYPLSEIKSIIKELIDEAIDDFTGIASKDPGLSKFFWLDPKGNFIRVTRQGHRMWAEKYLLGFPDKLKDLRLQDPQNILYKMNWIKVSIYNYESDPELVIEHDPLILPNQIQQIALERFIHEFNSNPEYKNKIKGLRDDTLKRNILLESTLNERLSFSDLYDETDDERIFKSKLPGMKVRPLIVSTNNDKDMWRFDYGITSHEKSEWERYHEKVGHRGHIYFYKEGIEPDDNLEDLECMVDCDCRDFKYRFAYANAQQDASFIGAKSLNKAINAPPIKTNPRRETKLCKHLAAIRKYLVTNIEKAFNQSQYKKRPFSLTEEMDKLANKGKFIVEYYDKNK